MRDIGVGSRGFARYNMGVRMLKERYLRRYREERSLAVKRTKNTMCLQMIRSEGSAVHFEHDLSMTGVIIYLGQAF